VHDSVTVNKPDTQYVYDTVYQTNTQYVHDTIYQTNTVYDTIVTVQVHYDTIVIVDTVVQVSNTSDESQAMGALQYYVDPLVLQFISQEFGLNDGWIYYLSAWQSEYTIASPGVYDIYGYIDYWATDWSGYYPLEYYYRITYKGGDPSNVNNWELGEPAASPARPSGISSVKNEGQRPGALMK
jgi:hypothetical protein